MLSVEYFDMEDIVEAYSEQCEGKIIPEQKLKQKKMLVVDKKLRVLHWEDIVVDDEITLLYYRSTGM